MANIALELQQIMSAIYGEEVRGSIHNAIDKINKVGEKTLNSGTDINAGDPAGAYYDNSLYINTDTNDLLRCNGTIWIKIGSIKGDTGVGITSVTGPTTVGLVDTYTINFDDGSTANFTVTNAKSIVAITGPISSGLTDTYRILFNDSTFVDFDVVNGKGITSIAKTGTVDLVDTYTITYNDSTTSTFTITNGKDGVNGNRWYRGSVVGGKNPNPTKFIDSGIAYAYVGDSYLNTSEGAIYHCETAGDPNVALWSFDFTMAGGGSGTTNYNELDNKPRINNVIVQGNLTTTNLGLDDYGNLTNKPTINGITMSGNKTGAQLSLATAHQATNATFNSVLATSNEDDFIINEDQNKIYQKRNGVAELISGYINSVESGQFVVDNGNLELDSSVTSKLVNLDSDGEMSGDHVNYDANNTVNDKIDGLETSKADASNVYTKAQVDSKVDETVKTSTVGSDGKTVTFTGIDVNKSYKIYADVGTSFSDISPVGIQSMTLNGTTLTYVLTNASSGMSCKLREIKL